MFPMIKLVFALFLLLNTILKIDSRPSFFTYDNNMRIVKRQDNEDDADQQLFFDFFKHLNEENRQTMFSLIQITSMVERL